MKTIKVFFNGERLKDIYPHATRWQVIKFRVRRAIAWVLKRVIIGGVAVASIVGVYHVGLAQADIKYVRGEAETILVEKPISAPVLERIKKAESKGNQFCTEELAKSKKFKGCYEGRIGMPLMNTNADGTTDWGICQINDYHWGAKARELGYNILTEEGNLGMCEWLFLNYGTDPWSASKANW